MSDEQGLTSARDSSGATDRATPAMPQFALNPVGRDFAMGDIHGCFTELQRGLDAIGFDAGTDRLFSVGDLVYGNSIGFMRPDRQSCAAASHIAAAFVM